MSLEPEDRYASGRALAEDIERWMADEPVTAYPEPWTRTLTRWPARHRTGVTAVGAAGLAALIGLAAVLGVQRQSNAVLAAKNNALDRANVSLREAIDQKDAANTALGEANGRVQARFELAREAIRSFKAGVEEEEALKEDRLRPLRDKLLGSARRFYDRLGDLLRGPGGRRLEGDPGRVVRRAGQADRPDRSEARGAGGVQEGGGDPPRAGGCARAGASASGSSWPRALNGLGEEAFQLGDHAAAWRRTRRPARWPSRWRRGRTRRSRPAGCWACPARCRRGAGGDREGRRRAGGLPPGPAGARGPHPRPFGRSRRPPRPGRQPQLGRSAAGEDRRPGRGAGRAAEVPGHVPVPWPPSTPPSPTTAAAWPSATTGSATCSSRPATWTGLWPSSGSTRS